MAREIRPKDYPKLKNYQPTRFMLPTSHYDKKKADRAVTFIENLCHTKGKWAGKRFWWIFCPVRATIPFLSEPVFRLALIHFDFA